MELGEKLLRARQAAGMSQRQLCGDEITRNMLSQIEHGTARPSMGTLQYLAARLGKPVSYFLEENAITSPNQSVMANARRSFDTGDYDMALEILEEYQGPDETFDRERQLLEVLLLLNLAGKAIGEGKMPYANGLLKKAGQAQMTLAYPLPDLERRRLLLLAQIPDQDRPDICAKLPSLDEELLLRGKAALELGDPEKAACLLDAAADQAAAQWCLLRGQVYMAQKDYASAARYFHSAEDAFPRETAEYLEKCYRELEDYKQAYFYACKVR